jgi:hypothetical protein
MNPEDGTAAVRRQAQLGRQLDELTETQQWVHHIADLDRGEVLTNILDRPVTPLSRIERLSRLGPFDDPSVFNGPSFRLTPRMPYQASRYDASPQAFLIAAEPQSYSAERDEIMWAPPRQLQTDRFLAMRFYFAESPHGRSVVSLSLRGKAWPGTTGHVLVRVPSAPAPVRVPIAETFAAHSVDVTFFPASGWPTEVLMSIEAGVELLTFSSISFRGPPPPAFDPGTL